MSGRCFSASSSHHVTCAMMSFTDQWPVTPGSVSCASDKPAYDSLNAAPRLFKSFQKLLSIHDSGFANLQFRGPSHSTLRFAPGSAPFSQCDHFTSKKNIARAPHDERRDLQTLQLRLHAHRLREIRSSSSSRRHGRATAHAWDSGPRRRACRVRRRAPRSPPFPNCSNHVPAMTEAHRGPCTGVAARGVLFADEFIVRSL